MGEMEEEIFQLEADDEFVKRCGEVLLTIKGHIVFHCYLCEFKYNGFQRYCDHLSHDHLLKTFECLDEDDDDETKQTESRGDAINISESCSSEFIAYEEECTEIIEIEPTTCNYDALEIKHELVDDESNIEVLEEDAFLVSKLLKTNMVTSEQNNLQYRCIKNSTADRSVHKTQRMERNLKITNINTLPTKNRSVEESHYVSCTDVSVTDSVNSILNADLDPEFYHELPSCDRPTLKRSRKPATSLADEERKHKCPYCPFASKDKTNLWSHIQRHSNNKPHQCTHCPKSFHTRVELTFHTRYHTGERPFLCTECARTFVTKEQLKQHMKRHKNQRDHGCTVCKKYFFSSQEVREHMTVHTKNTPFKCEICDGVFTRKKALTAHIKLHENKRSYKCKLCDAGFNQSAGLYLHMKAKHHVSKRAGDTDVNTIFPDRN